jgi:hypothetical protein
MATSRGIQYEGKQRNNNDGCQGNKDQSAIAKWSKSQLASSPLDHVINFVGCKAMFRVKQIDLSALVSDLETHQRLGYFEERSVRKR